SSSTASAGGCLLSCTSSGSHTVTTTVLSAVSVLPANSTAARASADPSSAITIVMACLLDGYSTRQIHPASARACLPRHTPPPQHRPGHHDQRERAQQVRVTRVSAEVAVHDVRDRVHHHARRTTRQADEQRVLPHQRAQH